MKLNGLIAATYTPLDPHGDLNLSAIGPMVEDLLRNGITGLYVCGSTGEGMSLTSEERRKVAEAYVEATAGRVPVIVQVGHNSVHEARQLASHAQAVGADVISATCPSYFKVSSVAALVDCMAELASGAPDLPFYYYHIPALTGSTIEMADFLQRGGDQIPNLVGLKYTDTKLFEFQHCMELEGGRFDVVWGCDEMLLGALATGARAGIGSTYNIAAPLYLQIMAAFEAGDFAQARKGQSLSIEMIRTIGRYPFHPAMKAILEMQGFHVGGCRLPQGRLSPSQSDSLRSELSAIGMDFGHAASLSLNP
ncbi:dihydrodipicolinate synthase family protein [Allorhodopirellula heiligendammensis]|uniref:N-acetylneuraminate lyase n=1 Tax=Allorhodopirellula heiligendammensis TaxID=2714739 RepID=A0A5C6C5B5_9BACT|nr:dihydrodipicolinate synthase family protein [Allorhodopirellula heiligendammensis]TWU18741.1 N-acetylneuraminate lyase [Allorhodopirellula heiligendammensis]